MEEQFFTWDSWDEINTGDLVFHDCTLTTVVGEFPVGTKLSSAFISFKDGTMEFYSEDDTKVIGRFKLELSATPLATE